MTTKRTLFIIKYQLQPTLSDKFRRRRN